MIFGNLVQKMKAGLSKTRANIMTGLESVFKGFTSIDDDLYDELMDVLVMADIGVTASDNIIKALKLRVKAEKVTKVEGVRELLVEEITRILKDDESELVLSSPSVILVIGVNGAGKTTSIGKLANSFKTDGKKVLIAAADTFRAAAIDQIEVWCKRSGVDIIKHQDNSDPGAVVFDAIQAAKARKADVMIVDTAGRLHNKKNLMEELRKIFRIISTQYPEAGREVFLVLDASTGQNALQQARMFKEVADITGIILTKLDGTAKGGIVIAIKDELRIPIRYVCIGEGLEDIQRFDAGAFAEALFSRNDD